MRLALIFAAGLCVAASAAPATAASGCVSQRFATPETTIATTVCSSAPVDGKVAVTQTFSAGGKSIERALTIELVPGATTSRANDAFDLSPLGVSRTLHIHLRYAAGLTRMTGGLLTPGAIPVTPQDR